jgi:hypothetical protein
MSNSIVEILYHQNISYNSLSYNSLEKIKLIEEKKYDSIKDIKDYNDKEKTLLAMFINKYININPLVSKYNKYIDFLFEPYNMLKYKPILRGYYNALLILYYSKISIIKTKPKTKILQVGILPSFIEAHFTLSNNDQSSSTYSFIKIESNKFDKIIDNSMLYDKLIDRLSKKIDISISHNKKFYDLNIKDLISKDNNKYDLIVFDTYKNISNINLDMNKNDIDPRYLSAIIHSKYILHQILYSVYKLENDGNLILLFPGFGIDIYHKIISLLQNFFQEIFLIHSDIDFSFRYYVICKNFNGKIDNIDNIMINLSSNDILTNINLKIENNIIKKFNDNLINKFRMIEQNINTISSYLKNIGLTIKLYNEQYYIQLSNTYNLLKKIFDVKKINQKTVKLLKKHSKKTENKLSIQSSYIHKYRILSDTKQIKIKNIKLTDQQFNELFYVLDYLKLYDIIFGDFKLDEQLGDINEYSVKPKDFSEYLNQKNISIKNIPTVVIRFKLSDITPLFVSLIYIYTNIYSKSYITKQEKTTVYYFIADQINDNISIDKLETFDRNKLIVSLSDYFINRLNQILSRLIINEMLMFQRIRYLTY